MANNKYYCPVCYLSTFSPDWEKMNKEFEEMIINLNKKKESEVKKNETTI